MNQSIDILDFTYSISTMMLAWFLLAAAFFVWGRFFARLLNLRITGIKGITAKIWLGFAFCLFFFSIYHLFFPINAFASSVFYFPALIVFFIKYHKKLLPFIKSIGRLKLTVIILTLLAASAISLQTPTNFDTGLYHLNSIRWNNEFHIIKGIGNLHSRLGFNQTFFLYCASLNFHPYLNDYAFHISNSFLYAVFFVGMILNGTFIDLLLAALFFFIPMPYHWLTSPTPDLASTLIQIVSFRYILDAFHFYPQSKERMSFISFSAILCALLITIKLSNIFYAAGLGIVTILFHIKYKFESIENKQLSKTFILIGSFFLIWVIRGYLQTGYPLFPSSIGKINFNWTVPQELAKKMENNVYAGSRSCETTFDINSPILKNYAWLPLWIKRNFYDEEIYAGEDWFDNLQIIITLILFPSTVNNWGIGSVTLFVLSLIFLVIWIASAINKKESFSKSNMLFYLFLSEIISIVFWFCLAPCPRFANGIFAILFTNSLLLIKTSFPNLCFNKNMKKALLFFSFFLLIWNFNLAFNAKEFYINGIKRLEPVSMRVFTTSYGLKILIPQVGIAQSWDSPIPSTIEPKKNLALLGNSIKDGFYLINKDN